MSKLLLHDLDGRPDNTNMPIAVRSRRAVSVALVTTALLVSSMLGMVVAGSASPVHAATPGKVTAWIPYWDQSRAMQSFLANADLYSAASPFWYEMATTGALTRYAGAEDATVLSEIRGKGVKVVPTISNNFDATRVTTMLATEATRAAHVQLLVNLVQANGYDGIDIDYESVAAADRDNFSAFIQSLASGLHAAGKLLYVAVHPKTSEPGTWNGPQAQNYAAIGAAADHVRVMTYDYSWSTSPAGPIAPLTWFTNVAAFTASVIAPAKVELGVNLYGYDWVGSNGDGQMYDVLQSRLASNGATRVWDSTSAEPHFSYIANGAAHTVYYGDAQSVAARLAVVDKYALAGVAFWHLGGEDAAVWTTVRNHWSSTTPTPSPDTTAPAVPSGVTATAGSRRITVAWHSATDTGGSGLGHYDVARGTARTGPWVRLGSATGLSLVSSGLTTGRAYWYVVTSVDNAGNVSAGSAPISAVAK